MTKTVSLESQAILPVSTNLPSSPNPSISFPLSALKDTRDDVLDDMKPVRIRHFVNSESTLKSKQRRLRDQRLSLEMLMKEKYDDDIESLAYKLQTARDDFEKEMKKFGQLLKKREKYLKERGEDLEHSRLILIEMKERWEADTQHVEELNDELKQREKSLIGCIEKWHEELVENDHAMRFAAELRDELAEYNKWFESLSKAKQIIKHRLLNTGNDDYNFTISKQDLFAEELPLSN